MWPTRWLTVLALASTPAWPTNLQLPSPNELAHGGEECFVGDKYCGDAFALASLLLEAENVRHVVTGRIVGVSGLPDTLDEELDVDVDFRISGVRKPAARCPHPPRIENAMHCEPNDTLPPEVKLRIPSDWFRWPPTGTSRNVARRGGEQLAALRALERDREFGRVDEREYAEAKERLEWGLQVALDGTTTPIKDGFITTGRDLNPLLVRLLEDRRARLEVGGEYLFALGDRVEGAAHTYYLPETPDLNDGEWHFFWGDEMREVEIALMLIGNCLLSEPPVFGEDTGPYLCKIYSRGLATFWLYPALVRRH